MADEHLHFVTGRLAEYALRPVAASLAERMGVAHTVDVLPITVAALMTPLWISRHAQIPVQATRVIVPGYCEGDLAPIQALTAARVERGPRDLRDLDEFFGQPRRREDYGAYDIEILAEINHAPRWPLKLILALAAELSAAGADLIDVGCEPGEAWSGVGECVRALKAEGYRVSIDSLNPAEIGPAVDAGGAKLVLSVNASNRAAAKDWGCEVVVIPDEFPTLGGLDETVELLAAAGVRLRIDPILEPIGCGFAASLGRYLEVRRRYPDVEMLMGIGNLTELTDADSAGINVLLMGFCQEVGVRSVLTTEVINWAQTSVRECDLARRLVLHAVQRRIPPKHLEPRLVTLRDPKVHTFGNEALDRLAAEIKDNNYRIFAENGNVHLVGAGLHIADRDPFVVFERLLNPGFGGAKDTHSPQSLDAAHAFYLGYELAKAATALTLDKDYRQDEALDWGYLTKAEESHRLRKSKASKEAAP